MARTKKQSLAKVSERKRQIQLEIQKESIDLEKDKLQAGPQSNTGSFEGCTRKNESTQG